MASPPTQPPSDSATEEQAVWSQIASELVSLGPARTQHESAVARINKVHAKIVNRQGPATTFTVKAAIKLAAIYRDAIDRIENEHKLLQSLIERLGILIALRDATETSSDSKRKKRKPDAKQSPQIAHQAPPKRAKSSIGSSDQQLDSFAAIFSPGDQVAALAGPEWILAHIIAYVPEKGKYEVEDADEDVDNNGSKKRYLLSHKHLLSIPKKSSMSGSAVGSPTSFSGTDPRTVREFPPKHKVLALYPSTTCFYSATVALPPSKSPTRSYHLIFADDDNRERTVDPHFVIDDPSPTPI